MKIITDTSCDLPEELISKYNIKLVPFYIHIGDASYKDRYEITNKEIYQYLAKDEELPTTSAPNPKDFIDVIEPILKTGESVFISTISSKLSATYEFANNATRFLKSPDVYLMDSGYGSGFLGLLAIDASILAQKGNLPPEVIISKLNSLKETSLLYGFLDTVKNLWRSGRISKIKYFISSLINAKPILSMKDGAIVPVTRARGKKQAIDLLIQTIRDKVRNKKYDCMITHSNCVKTANKILSKIEEFVDIGKGIVSELSPALSVHLGLGAVLVSLVPSIE